VSAPPGIAGSLRRTTLAGPISTILFGQPLIDWFEDGSRRGAETQRTAWPCILMLALDSCPSTLDPPQINFPAKNGCLTGKCRSLWQLWFLVCYNFRMTTQEAMLD
jgi:hypothetical protein